MKLRHITFIFVVLASSVFSIKAESDIFVINSKNPVSFNFIKNIENVLSLIKIDHPNAQPVFLYSHNNVDFCMFALNQNNQYLIFASPLFDPNIKLTVNNENKTDDIKVAYIKTSSVVEDSGNNDLKNNSSGEEESARNSNTRPFAFLIEIDKDDICKLFFESTFNFGNYEMVLDYNNRWWNGKASIVTNDAFDIHMNVERQLKLGDENN